MITPQTNQTKATHDQIAALAYDLWEKSGNLPNHDLAFWLEAERKLNEAQPKLSNHVRGNNKSRRTGSVVGKG